MCTMKSCCCCCSVKDGTVTIGVVTIMQDIATIIYVAVGLAAEAASRSPVESYFEDSPYSQHFTVRAPDADIAFGRAVEALWITKLVGSVLSLIVSSLLIHGARKNMRYLMLPWIIIEIPIVALCCMVFLVALFTVDMTPLAAVLFVLSFLLLSFAIYCIVCVMSHFNNLRRQEEQELIVKMEGNAIGGFGIGIGCPPPPYAKLDDRDAVILSA